MSKFDTKNLIYEVNKLNKENADLQAKLEELEKKLKACGFCKENCGNDHCVTKDGK